MTTTKTRKPKRVTLDREKLDELLRIGQYMSNVCCNLSQPSRPLDDCGREQMGQLYRAWDQARRELEA